MAFQVLLVAVSACALLPQIYSYNSYPCVLRGTFCVTTRCFADEWPRFTPVSSRFGGSRVPELPSELDFRPSVHPQSAAFESTRSSIPPVPGYYRWLQLSQLKSQIKVGRLLNQVNIICSWGLVLASFNLTSSCRPEWEAMEAWILRLHVQFKSGLGRKKRSRECCTCQVETIQ